VASRAALYAKSLMQNLLFDAIITKERQLRRTAI
jgi:hypothetical protein